MALGLCGPAFALTLPDLIAASASAHPSVLAAKLETDSALDSVEAAKRQYWPSFSAQVESTGAPAGESQFIRGEQTLWNGNLTRYGVEGAELKLGSARTKLAAQQQKLALQVGDAWRALWAAQGNLRVAESTLAQLRRFEEMIRRRVLGELSVPVELELVQARLLQVRVDVSRARADSFAALQRLEQLTGLKGLRALLEPLPVGQDAAAFGAPVARLQSVLARVDEVVAYQPEVTAAREEVLSVRQQTNIRRAQTAPQAYARVDKYMSGTHDTKAYIGLTYSTGAGFSSALEIEALAKRILAAEQSVESVTQEIRQSLELDLNELLNAQQRLAALSQSVRGALLVLESYERQFVASRKSWQDLMNAVRELGQTEFARSEAETQLVGALLRIQLRVDPKSIDSNIAGGLAAKEAPYAQ